MTTSTRNPPKTTVNTKAGNSNRHILYQKSVQDPQTEVSFMTEKYKLLRGHDPVTLREDFCGTAYLATEWCKSNPAYKAQGVDLCTDTLQWGREHNLAPAGDKVSSRIQLYNDNVLDFYNENELADIICAFNFSYNILKPRKTLVDYFKNTRRGLNDDGILVLDIFGGHEAYDTVEEEREVDGEDFTYVWEQASFNPITHEMQCYIHFVLEDGTRIDKAFEYEWRLRTIPEIVESLYEAGYSNVRCYWEEFIESDDDDEFLEETGNYYETEEVENQESWISYLIAEK